MIPWTEIVIRLCLAAFLGAMIGLERERKDWAAGLRTHMMVCLAAALAMIVSTYGFNDVVGREGVAFDPSHVAAQVISGIGFIGAGAILFLRQGVIRGLTTASAVWTAAVIGLAAGGGLFFAACVTTVLALIILWILQPFEQKYLRRFKQKSLRITTTDEAKSLEIMNKIFQTKGLDIASCVLDKSDEDCAILVKFSNFQQAALTQLLEDLHADATIREVDWSNRT